MDYKTLMEISSYQDCLDSIFSSYTRVKPQLTGLFDREARSPQIVCAIAKELELIPPQDVTVRITGSKGKGTTTRLIAHGIQMVVPTAKVGMLVSPEELDHTDRIRIDRECISQEEFVECYSQLLPSLKNRELAFGPMQYFSPSGLFLLVALYWFKKSGVTHFVLEGGRGVAFDEVGNIPSAVSVVTSIFSEHLSSLGPTEAHVAADKLSIAHSSNITILGPTAAAWNDVQKVVEAERCFQLAEIEMSSHLPAWVLLNRKLAAKAVGCLLGISLAPENLCMENEDFPSFGTFKKKLFSGFYDALISKDSLDFNFYQNFLSQNRGRAAAIVSLPNDKDVERIVSTLQDDLLLPVFHVTLKGTRGYLEYSLTHKLYNQHILACISFNDASALAEQLRNFSAKNKFMSLAVLGTQSFIRLFRRALEELL